MASLEGRYDYKVAEAEVQRQWTENRIYEFDLSRGAAPAYTVDTPPPTVSGQIHVGHVYSYTQADVVIRYHRMRGEQVLYPFGFDDNGLPTERFTENSRGMRARDVGRQAFIDACLELSAEVEDKFERFWKRLGLSVDWRLRYSTIDPRSRRVSQAAFLDLYDNGHVYRQEAPTLWCPECRTAVAQADVDDKAGVSTAFSTIPFSMDDGRQIRIATTRPELLAACVAVFVHPDDDRYASYVGHTATTPLFQLPVPVLTDSHVDRQKGTGAVMCCTFGDVADVTWWRTYGLPLRIVLQPDGRLNDLAGPYAGLRVSVARARILADLQEAGLILEQRQIEHSVGVHERCGTDIEYLVAGQWFIALLSQKDWFLEAGRSIRWHPEHMRSRYESWIEGLNWDWNISRQRSYGVPFPVWYCANCAQVVTADRQSLPIDPQQAQPTVPCPRCGSTDFVGETDVMDTWATSSVTPRICATLLDVVGIDEQEFVRRFHPMTLRPNAHDIIRTWDFYTIVRSLYASGQIPWTDVLISGHALDPAGKKISKSKLKAAEDPTAMLDTYSADAVRYWATSVRTGGDTLLSDEVMRNGGRLVTKLWNAARLVLPHLDGYTPPVTPSADLTPLDRWLLARLQWVTERATANLDAYEFAAARAEVERFFWADLCDNYLEMVKFRLYGDKEDATSRGRSSARYALYHSLLSVLKLLAPYLPHVTETIYRAGFAETDGSLSVHVATWPLVQPALMADDVEAFGEAALAVADQVRRWKAERQMSVGAEVARLDIRHPASLAEPLRAMETDLRSVTRATDIVFVLDDSIDTVQAIIS